MQIVISNPSVVAKVQSLDSFVITYALSVVLIIEPEIVSLVQFYWDICHFLVSILDYKPCHIPFIYRCPVKKSDHMIPSKRQMHLSDLNWTSIFKWYLRRRGSEKGYQNELFLRDWSMCSENDNCVGLNGRLDLGFV